MSPISLVRRACVAAALLTFAAFTPAAGQSAQQGATPKRAPVCAKGVRVFTERSDIPVPFDTLRVPPSDGPVRVTSPEEAEAAELALRGRAGSVGATGVLITDVRTEDGSGNMQLRRQVTGVYVAADSAKAQAACR